MLQQTTVATVLPYYERFLKRFPDVKALAAASEDEVLKLWAGLGYYSRARCLHRAAGEVVAEHGGRFPSDFDAALSLPGIGRYTAGAILSIAFNQPRALVDGNVMRVFSRLFGIRGNIKRPETVKGFWARAEELVPQDRPGDWNQALMELGATVCLPESPLCGACPLSKICAAKAEGIQDRLPVTDKRPDFIPLTWSCLWIEKDGEVLLWRRSEKERFLKKLWGLPEARHLDARAGRLLKTVRHTITNHKIDVKVHQAEWDRRPPASARWIERDKLNDYLISSLWLKCVPMSRP